MLCFDVSIGSPICGRMRPPRVGRTSAAVSNATTTTASAPADDLAVWKLDGTSRTRVMERHGYSQVDAQ